LNKILLAGLAFIVLAVSACGSAPTPTPVPPTLIPVKTATPLPTATATPLPTATPSPFPTPANPGASLSSIFKAWGNVKTFRAKTTTTGGTAGTQEMTIEVVMPNKFHMTSKDAAGKELEMYLIGTAFYMKVGTKWQKVTTGTNLDFANPAKIAASMGAQKDVKFLGVEVVDNVPTLIYQYTPTTKVVTKVWIGALDSLPRKSESEPKAGQKTTVSYYDYNASITITAPI
jgi:hypothetical protein